MNTQSNLQNELDRVLEKICEIAEKSAGGDYIYRGEPEEYKEKPYDGRVSSNLYREYLDVEAEHFDIAIVQKEILDEAREYIGEPVSDFEILTELQHRGGTSNLIDFTTDYLIALFFACDGSHNKPGRVILLEKESENYKVEKASKTINRAESQKSIFVQSDTGFIESKQYKVICIPSDLKMHMLNYLQKHHDISTRTIYNDLQGFIENQRIHRSAYTEFYRSLTCQERGNVAETLKEKHEHYENAVKHYTEALKLNPQMLEAYHNHGIVYSNKGEYDEALQAFSRVIELDPDYADAYYYRGLAYLRNGEYDEALQAFSRVIELDPDYADAYYYRGLAYHIKDEPDEALQAFSRVIELDPDYADAYYYRGLAYLRNGEYDEALQAFSRVIELDPDYADAYYYRGLVYHIKDEYDEALQAFSRVIELDSDYADAYYYRGLAYHIKDEPDEALQDYNTAIEINSDCAGAYNARGVAYRLKGNIDLAIKDYNTAIKLDPDDTVAYCNRGEAWLHLKEWGKARADLTIARDKEIDIIASFHNDYESVEDFEQKNDIKLPADIAAMLQRQ